MHRQIHILFYMLVMYLVKTSEASERTLQLRPLPVRLVIEPECRNFSKSLLKHLTFQPLSENIRIKFLSSKTINLYKFPSKCVLQRCLVAAWSGLVCISVPSARQSIYGVDGCAPVWELMNETSNTCSD